MRETVIVEVQRMPEAEGLPLPDYATPDAAGMDLLAAVEEDLVIAPGERKLISTGLKMAIPPGYEGQVRPRSGLALRHGVTLLNTPGTIDSDYRGIVGVILVNLGNEDFTVRRGDRIAQMLICPVSRAEMVECESLSSTFRSEGGFGHTGLGVRASSLSRPVENETNSAK